MQNRILFWIRHTPFEKNLDGDVNDLKVDAAFFNCVGTYQWIKHVSMNTL